MSVCPRLYALSIVLLTGTLAHCSADNDRQAVSHRAKSSLGPTEPTDNSQPLKPNQADPQSGSGKTSASAGEEPTPTDDAHKDQTGNKMDTESNSEPDQNSETTSGTTAEMKPEVKPDPVITCASLRAAYDKESHKTCAAEPQLCTQHPLQTGSIFAEHMVLQRGKPMIWGKGYPGEFIKVSIGSREACTTASAGGRWQVQFTDMAAGGPTQLTVTGDAQRSAPLVIEDVLIGDVWLCSGQSNMYYSMGGAGAEDARTANYPLIRYYTVKRLGSREPQETLSHEFGSPGWDRAQPTPNKPSNLIDFSAVAFYFGRMVHERTGVPIGLIAASAPGTKIEPFIPPKSSEPFWGDVFNGMIHPLLPLAIKGFLWYQGESNVGEGLAYHRKQVALIQGWRERFGNADLPFYFVQLASYSYPGQAPDALPWLWQAQTMARRTPRTGMVVITDASTVEDIHPPNKKPVGERLALWALAHDYAQTDIAYAAPLPSQMQIKGSQAVITFAHAEGGLRSRDGAELAPYFELAGADGVFHKATAAVIQGQTITVNCDRVSLPVQVRFAWSNTAQPPLVNQAGLVAGAFLLPDLFTASN